MCLYQGSISYIDMNMRLYTYRTGIGQKVYARTIEHPRGVRPESAIKNGEITTEKCARMDRILGGLEVRSQTLNNKFIR